LQFTHTRIMVGMQNPPLFLTGSASFTANGDALPKQFTGQLYSGAAVMGNVYVDLESMELEAAIPVLFQHDQSKVVGTFSKLDKSPAALAVEGVLFTEFDADAQSIVKKSQSGMQWQMSMGVFDYTIEDVPAGKTLTVNTREVTGPAMVLRGAVLREGSIVALGADKHTSASFFSNRASAPISQKEGAPMPTQAEFDELKTQLAQAEAKLAAQAQALAELEQSKREGEVKALFSDIGREFSAESAKVYMGLSADSFAALAADLRANHKPASLPSSLTQSTFAASGAPAGGNESVLLASAKAMHNLK
jgi:hypothetical protein